MKKLLFFAISMVLTANLLYAQNFLQKKAVEIGKPVSDFQLQSVEGKQFRLSESWGKVVMIHFWSATCPFVRRYESRLQKLANDFASKDVVVIGIDSNVNETADQIRKVAEERKVNYPILLDPGNKVADQFGAVTTPHIFILDREGKLVYEGSVDDQGWDESHPVTKNYAHDVLDAVSLNTPAPYSKTITFGCTVKRK